MTICTTSPSLPLPSSMLLERPLESMRKSLALYYMTESLTTIKNDTRMSDAHVEYVLKAARLAVKFGRCSGSSHGRTWVWRIGSWVGGLSTMYEIQACHPGSICDLYSHSQHPPICVLTWRNLTDRILGPCSLPILCVL